MGRPALVPQANLAKDGRAMGYWHVEAGPLVRSSYHASNHRPEAEA